MGRSAPAETLEAMLRAVERILDESGVSEPRAEARHVLRAAGFPGEEIVGRPERFLAESEAGRILEIARRRGAREPLSRILGERAFYGRAFAISPATLDPRADTETLIEAALEIAREEGWSDAPIRIIDVGTGSGCLLVTVLAELPRATGVGTDVNPDALLVAEENARRHGVAARARFAVRRSLLEIDETFDMLISNPPYIRTADMANLAPEVRDHDPRAALDGGSDGLDVYLEIAYDLARTVPDGWALFEVGAGQAEDATTEVDSFCDPRARRRWREWTDLGNHVRCIGVRIRS